MTGTFHSKGRNGQEPPRTAGMKARTDAVWDDSKASLRLRLTRKQAQRIRHHNRRAIWGIAALSIILAALTAASLLIQFGE